MRSLIIMAASAVLVLAPPAQAKRHAEAHPYLEIDQTALADLKNGGGATTYTTVAAGIDAFVSNTRAEAQVSYRGEYRIGYGHNNDSTQVHSGIARGRIDAVPQLLSIEGGALATRTRSDIRGGVPVAGIGNPINISQVYAGYVGPRLATNVSGLDIGAFYRFGYTKADAETRGLTIAGTTPLDSFDSSTNHVAGASIGMRSGFLPFGWTVSANYTRDDASQLDQRYEGKFARADIIYPVTPTVAMTGGVGYEKIESSQRDPLRNANGVPIVDSSGRYVTNPASPRLLAYDTSGLIWDGGVVWRPSPRTSLQAKVGWRYGDVTFGGAFSWQVNESQAVQVNVYDGLQTFGRQVIDSLSTVPTRFTVSRDPFNGQFGGCVFGSGDSGAGACLSPALQSVSSGVYRSSGVNALWRYNRAGWRGGLALGYDRRHFFAPRVAGFGIDGITDENVYAQANLGRELSDGSGVEGGIYANWSNSGLANTPAVLGFGATGSYYRQLFRSLSGSASLGLYSTEQDGQEDSLIGAAQLGMRYTF